MNLGQKAQKLIPVSGVLTLAVLLLLALVMAACREAKAGPTPPPNHIHNYTQLSGNIAIDGSSTVFPITEAVAEEFGGLTGGRVRVTVGISGTGGGFQKFCNGETDIANASRPIQPIEVARCAQRGVEYIEIPIAIDGLTVVVNPRNTFARCLTVEELHIIWAPEAEGRITRWNQVRPEWPDDRIRLYGPGVDSGSFDYFTEVVNGRAQVSRPDYIASEYDNVLVLGVAGDRNGLGYFGYAYYVVNAHRLTAVAMDSGDGCVSPTDETIQDGSYSPLSRPIFVYVRTDAAARTEVQEFMGYYLGSEGQRLVSRVGYVPYSLRVYELALDRFERGLTGTLFGGDSPQRGTVEEVLAANQ